MNWINDNASWVAWGLFLFFGLFVAAFFLRNRSAKTDEDAPVEKQSRETNVGIKKSEKL